MSTIRVLFDVARVEFALNVTMSILEYFKANHPEIYQKAFLKSLDKHEDQLNALLKLTEELNKDAKIQEETNATDGV